MRPLRWLCVLLVAAGMACHRKEGAPTPRLVEIHVVDRGADLSAADEKALADRASTLLRAAGLESALGSAARPADLRLSLSMRSESAEVEGKLLLRAFVEARLVAVESDLSSSAIESRALGERVVDAAATPDRGAALRAHRDRAASDVLSALAAKMKIHLGGRDAVRAALRGDDGELRLEAMRVAGERKDRELCPDLIALLGKDAEVRDPAIGALVAMGDRRAVRSVIDVARFRDVTELPKVIDAVAALGGDEARAYLEFVSSGHDDPEVQALAKEALDRLARREAAGDSKTAGLTPAASER